MNQKQKDLLCKMLRDRADKIKEELQGKLPLSSVRLNYDGRVSTRAIREEENELGLSGSFEKRRKALVKRDESLERQKSLLCKDWEKLADEVGEIREVEVEKFLKAKNRLTEAIEHAVVNIQFAESADDARAVLDGLPDASELLGS